MGRERPAAVACMAVQPGGGGGAGPLPRGSVCATFGGRGGSDGRRGGRHPTCAPRPSTWIPPQRLDYPPARSGWRVPRRSVPWRSGHARWESAFSRIFCHAPRALRSCQSAPDTCCCVVATVPDTPSTRRPVRADAGCLVDVPMACRRRGAGRGSSLRRTRFCAAHTEKRSRSSLDGRPTGLALPGKREGGVAAGQVVGDGPRGCAALGRAHCPQPQSLRTGGRRGEQRRREGLSGGTRSGTLAGLATGHDATGEGAPTSALTHRHLGNEGEGRASWAPRKGALLPAVGPPHPRWDSCTCIAGVTLLDG